MKPAFHVPHRLLLDYAAGAVDADVSLFVATHLRFCARCRRRVARVEQVAGSLLEAEGGCSLDRISVQSVLAEIDRRGAGRQVLADGRNVSTANGLPAELADRAAAGTHMWETVAQGLRRLDLATEARSGRLLVWRACEAATVPEHGHETKELTLVLEGAMTDGGTRFHPGDVLSCDPGTRHAPALEPGSTTLCLQLPPR